MKYPDHTESNPLSLKEARKVIRALKSGKAISNPESKAMIKRIKLKYGHKVRSNNVKIEATIFKK